MRQEQSSTSKKECFKQTRQSCLKDWKRRIEVMTKTWQSRECEISGVGYGTSQDKTEGSKEVKNITITTDNLKEKNSYN